MSRISHRLARIEDQEGERIIAEMLALPEREWFRRGYCPVDRLPESEWAELWALLERLFDESGWVAYPDALTSDEYRRLHELINCSFALNRAARW
jgi:hypothetical protein